MRHTATLAPLAADDLTWTIAGPSPWRDPARALDLALAALPAITDPLARGTVCALLVVIVELREQTAAQRQLIAAGLSTWERKARADVRRRREAEGGRQGWRRGAVVP